MAPEMVFHTDPGVENSLKDASFIILSLANNHTPDFGSSRRYSALVLMKTIDVSYPTAWLMLQKIRAAMSERDKMYQLSGLIQLDEAFFGGPDGKQGRGTDKMAAYGAVSTTDEGKPLRYRPGGR